MSGSVRNACRHLRRKGLRSLLTMSGIVIGVALVAIVTVISAAGEAAVERELENMGLGGLSVTATDMQGVETAVLDTLRAMPQVDSAVPLMIDTSAVSSVRGGTTELMLCGIDSGETQVIGLTQLHGRMLSKADVASSARVCVVDGAVAKAVYARENIVGKTLTLSVGGIYEAFEVVGVTEAGSALLQNVARLIPGMVYIPYTTMQQLGGRTTFDQLAVRLTEGTDADKEARHIEQVLATVSGERRFAAENLAAQRDKLAGVMDIVTLVLTAISAISLLVSGLSIMTVMTVSVGERTREIGIKKALGATDGRILREFLTEAVVLSLCGGVIGVAIGAGLGTVGLSLVGVSVSVWGTMAGLVVFAVLIGAVFGVYPALKAARLDPVEALRCE
ncbi:MAG: FtsX-like permease family protein [Ruminococcaceae bacterium]|nr:FtsX-like permease family protein [Oscillospiraceae bacterium]